MRFEDETKIVGKVSGNNSVLTKVDKLRELIGTRIGLPQLVVVGDQSSGKSSVLENLTGFAFPRDAELCTRYATQITCRRETAEGITVTIIPGPDSSPEERARVQEFHCTVSDLNPESIANIFRDANTVMGISTPSKKFGDDGLPLPAFSEHMLRIEKQGPEEEHFTVIDVPGIFRRETEGVTTEQDISLVLNMVKRYMKDSRTIILAIIPSNVDPATQEILKLAKHADPTMSRTMAVLTKPDLAIEQTTMRIAIDHVKGKRGELTLGYYVVKNRGPDPEDACKTLEQAQADERNFFSKNPWSELAATGKAGIACLKRRVQELLTDLIKKEFPLLKSEVAKELTSLSERRDALGVSRSDQHAQRIYLSKISEAFQSLARDALNAYYVGNEIFTDHHDLRLITRIVEVCEIYANDMVMNGHTRPFENSDSDEKPVLITANLKSLFAKELKKPAYDLEKIAQAYPELETILHFRDTSSKDEATSNINEYIDAVYRSSRGQDLGNLGNGLLATLFKEQSKNWEDITLEHLSVAIYQVHHFISKVISMICPDRKVHEELWNGYLLEELMISYRRAIDHAKFLLRIEREGSPLTLNNSLTRNGQKMRTDKMIKEMTSLGVTDDNHPGRLTIDKSLLELLSANKESEVEVREQMHDLLSSYYEIARNRFVDVVYQQAINHCLLFGKESPLKIFNTEMVMGLNEDQLEIIAAEDSVVKRQREKLARDIANFQEAHNVLRGR